MRRTDRGGQLWLGLVVGALVAAAAIGPSGSDAQPPMSEAMRVRMAQFDSESTWAQGDILVLGARIFDNRCAACHGDEGLGDGDLADVLPIKPRNYHDEPFKWGSSPSRIATSIASGRSEIMPPFKVVLSEEEIWAVAYVVWRWIPSERREIDDPAEAQAWSLP